MRTKLEDLLDLAEIELIRSALRYYGNGVAYQARQPFDNALQTDRRVQRQGRARLLANALDKAFPTTIDEDGTGVTVREYTDAN
jgi:hypothetical protein